MAELGGDADIKQLSTRVVYRNKWMTLREDEIERRDGSRGIYAVMEKPDFAIVLPYEDDGFHMVEQYRYPVGGRYWEFPQGTLSEQTPQPAVEIARIELLEETGITASAMTALGRLSAGYGTSMQWCHAFLATGLTHGIPRVEQEEQDMRRRWIRRADLEEEIRSGQVVDDSSIAAYSLFLLRRSAIAASGNG